MSGAPPLGPAAPSAPGPGGELARAPAAPPPLRLRSHLRAGLVLLVLSIVLLGAAYPAAITAVAQTVVPGTANGSLITVNGTVIGSRLIAQNLSAPWLFWERPSPGDYDSFNGSPTALGYSDPALANETESYLKEYGFSTVNASVPAILVTVSGSGLDPDLTPEAVLVQIPRIAGNSSLSDAELLQLVNAHIVPPLGGFVGPAYVDVLELDLALLPLEGRSV